MKQFFALIILLQTHSLQAYPQFVKSGYFSCNSCHVSHNGGDALTPYGRGFSVEMLTMTGKEGQAEPLWHVESLPENLLLAGHLRWLQTFSDTAARRSAANFWMQKDIDLGFHSEPFTAYVTAAELPLDPTARERELALRKWLTRGQVGDYFNWQLGATLPKFGLMLNDHNALVNQAVGQKPGAETGRLALGYLSETVEVTLSTASGDLPVNSLGEAGYVSAQWSGYFAYFLAEKHRIALGALQTKTERTSQAFSVSGTLTLGAALTSSVELQHIRPDVAGPERQFAAYFDLVFEPLRGLWLQPVLEMFLSDYPDPRSKIEKQQLRLSIFPVPHFDLKLAIGQTKNHADYSFGNFGSILLHYWL